MTLSPLTLGVLGLALLSVTLTGCEARFAKGEIPTERIDDSGTNGGDDGNGGSDDTPDNGDTCVDVATTTRSSYYGYYASKTTKVHVATCAAQRSLREEVRVLGEVVSNLTAGLTSESLSADPVLHNVEDRLAQLEGEKNLIRVFLTYKESQRRVCAINSHIEAAELCRRFGFPLNDPYFIHVPCNSAGAASYNDICYKAPKYWVLKPNCFGYNQANIFSCFEEPPEGGRCSFVVYLSCRGYAQGRLAQDPTLRNRLPRSPSSDPDTMDMTAEG